MKLHKKQTFTGGGIILLHSVQDAMQTEKLLLAAGYPARLIAPPPELRKGCDLAVEINPVEQPGIERLLRQKQIDFIEVRPVTPGEVEILEVVRVTDFGDWVMVKAANMKLTYEKATGIIVNTSGGGCPDIPVMHAALLDKKVEEAPRPRDIGYTLCSLMLDRALEEAIALRREGDASC